MIVVKEGIVNRKRFEEITKNSIDRRGEIMGLRGDSYGKNEEDEDTLSAFKETAEILNTLQIGGRADHKPSEVAMTLIVLKLVRDSNLRLKGVPATQAIRVDSRDDMHNYLDLGFACEIDEEEARDKEKELPNIHYVPFKD